MFGDKVGCDGLKRPVILPRPPKAFEDVAPLPNIVALKTELLKTRERSS